MGYLAKKLITEIKFNPRDNSRAIFIVVPSTCPSSQIVNL